MNRSELLVLIGDLLNDPNHERYTSNHIYTELDNSQRKWNTHAKILKDTATISAVTGTRQYALSNLTGTPIAFTRATFDNIEMDKVDKNWFDLYSSGDWTEDVGTPNRYFIEALDPDVQYINVHPTPSDTENGESIVVEYVKDHTPMASDSDEPFNASPLMVPYHWGLAYDVASRLLARDPSPENAIRSSTYFKISTGVLNDVQEVFKALEKEEPPRLRGGRYWRSGV